MIQLRDYQQRAVDEIRGAFRTKNAVLYQLPTGGGKTLTAGHILGAANAKGNAGMFICNRVELVEQTMKAFDKLSIRYGVIAAGYTPNWHAGVQIASIDTLKRRLGKIIVPPKLIVWDECRGLGAAGWKSVYGHFLGSKHLGLDATPCRLDGQGLGQFFQHLVLGPTYKELQAFGSLVPFKVFAPGAPDMTNVSTAMGEFSHAETEAVMDRPTITGDIVNHYVQHARGKKGITFAVSRKHSEHLAEQYRAAGVRAVHLDGDSDKDHRMATVAAFRRGEVEVLCNVDLFTAGFDVPGVEVITMTRPTQSLSVFLQQAGRGSRPEGAKTHCLLLDHAGNVFRHGLPDQDREWSLEMTRKKRKKGDEEPQAPVKQCEQCYAIFVPAPICPACGAEMPVNSREVEEVDGELREIDAEKLAADIAKRKAAAAKRSEVGMADTLEDLKRIAAERGYSPNWAQHVFDAKGSRSDRGATRAQAQFEAYARR